MANAPAASVEGLTEFRRALRELGPQWPKELARENREIAQWITPLIQARARSMRGPYAHFAPKIKARGTTVGARVEIPKEANATFWGAIASTGWNVGNDGDPQHPPWVGSSWDVGVAGQGPYAINATITTHLDEIVERYGDAIDRLTAAAFPN